MSTSASTDAASTDGLLFLINQGGVDDKDGGIGGSEGGGRRALASSKKRSRPETNGETEISSLMLFQPLPSSSTTSSSSSSSSSSSFSIPINFSGTTQQNLPSNNRSVQQNLRLLQVSMTEFKKNSPALRTDIAERVSLVKHGAAWARCLQQAKDDATPDRSERDKLLLALPERTVKALPDGEFAGVIKIGDDEILTSSFPTVLEAAVCADYGTSFLRAHEIEQSPVIDAVRVGVRELTQIAAEMNESFSFSALMAPNVPRLNFPGSAADCRVCPPLDPWPPLVLLAWEIAESAAAALLAPAIFRPLPSLPTRTEWNSSTEEEISPYMGLESIHTSIGMWLPLNVTFDKLFYSELAVARRAARMNVNLTSLSMLSSSPPPPPPLLSSSLTQGAYPQPCLPNFDQSATIFSTPLPQIRPLSQFLLPPPLLYLEAPPSPDDEEKEPPSLPSLSNAQDINVNPNGIKVKGEVHFDKTAIQWLIENKKIEPISDTEEDDEDEEYGLRVDTLPIKPDGDLRELELEKKKKDSSSKFKSR
jgi:hypothetical protein